MLHGGSDFGLGLGRGVCTSEVFEGSAFAWRRSVTISACPKLAAWWSAVCPSGGQMTVFTEASNGKGMTHLTQHPDPVENVDL
jgi:hypothetical protein